MRDAFFNTLYECALEDDKVIFITGDLGYKLVDKFAKQFPKRFINAGIAEANMVSMAAGLALEGFKPYVYSIVPFATMRCFEQIRNDVVHNNLNVKVVGVGGGYAYGFNGPSHHSVEDVAILRTLPNMTIVAPGDPTEARAATKAFVKHDGPGYLRLGRAGEKIIHSVDIDFEIGRALKICDETYAARHHFCSHWITCSCLLDEVVILSTGSMLKTAIEVRDKLADLNIKASIMSVHTIKPLDVSGIFYEARYKKMIITLEEHSIIGGLFSSIMEEIAVDSRIEVLPFAIPDKLCHDVGDQNYLKEKAGLSTLQIVEKIKTVLESRC